MPLKAALEPRQRQQEFGSSHVARPFQQPSFARRVVRLAQPRTEKKALLGEPREEEMAYFVRNREGGPPLRGPGAADDAVLDASLEAATRALLAAHPELCGDRLPRAGLEAVIRGHRLLHLALNLQVALARYRQAALPAHASNPDATDDLDARSLDDLDAAGSAD